MVLLALVGVMMNQEGLERVVCTRSKGMQPVRTVSIAFVHPLRAPSERLC